MEQQLPAARTWETSMEFFLTGVAETAEQASATARDLIAMFGANRQQIAGLGRAAPSALRIHELMQANPIVAIQTVSEKLAASFPAASTALLALNRNDWRIEIMRCGKDVILGKDAYANRLGNGLCINFSLLGLTRKLLRSVAASPTPTAEHFRDDRNRAIRMLAGFY